MNQPGDKDGLRLPVYQVYLLGQGFGRGADGTVLTSYPYTIHYAPNHPSGEFFLAEGDARVGNGGFIPAAQILGPMWREHLEITGTLWLLPLLEQHTHGDRVTPAQWLEAYQKVNASPPRVEEWKQY